MASINQTGAGIRLPNFCNLGVMFRVLVIDNLFVLAAAVMRSRQASELAGQFLVGAAAAEAVLIVSLTLLCAGRRVLHLNDVHPSPLELLVTAGGSVEESCVGFRVGSAAGDGVPHAMPTASNAMNPNR